MLTEAQRRQTLAAMGIDVYLSRAAAAATSALEPTDPDVIVICTQAAIQAEPTSRLRNVLPRALGCAAARIAWICAAPDGALGRVPNAAAYLALGQTLTDALTEHLNSTQRNSIVIAVADEPAIGLRDGLSRRALWQILKPIARALRTAAD